jgi:hypothetical protein
MSTTLHCMTAGQQIKRKTIETVEQVVKGKIDIIIRIKTGNEPKLISVFA